MTFQKLFTASALTFGVFFYSQANAKLFPSYEIPDEKAAVESFGFSRKPHLPKDFNILIWNIKKGEYKQQWAQDFLALSEDADLVLSQEAMIDSVMPPVLRSKENFAWNFATSFLLDDGSKTGVVTGSTTHMVDFIFFRSPGREPVIKTPKVALATFYELENSTLPLMVVNIHALNFTANERFMDQIDVIFEKIKSYPGPALFAGDFNTWNKDRKNYLSRKALGAGMEEVPFKRSTRVLILDHAYVRGLKVNTSKVRNDIKSSDHYPLQVSVSAADFIENSVKNSEEILAKAR